MNKRKLIVYCDESIDRGKYYSNFYGGALIDEKNLAEIESVLNQKKADLNLNDELKWTKISQQYQGKYIDFIDVLFDFITSGKIKIRIMFRHNIYAPVGLSDAQKDNQYFLLYYQMIKHAFGFEYANDQDFDEVEVKLFLDDIPDTAEKYNDFKDYICSMNVFPIFKEQAISFKKENIHSVSSHKHVILQGLDIVIGAMQFRLNDLHKVKPEGQRIRGKRTIAKEKVYKHINEKIRRIYPNFNIGMSTSFKDDKQNIWLHPYRHWCFKPLNYKMDESKIK